MPKASSVTRKVAIVLCGFLAGVVFMLMLELLKDDPAKWGLKDILKPGDFGDIQIVRGNSSEWPEAGEALAIIVGDSSFFYFIKNNSNDITNFYINEGKGRDLVEAEIKDGKLSKIGIICNDESGVFVVEKSEDAIWQYAKYFHMNTQEKFSGESYEDIDFDGQFDCKKAFGGNSEVIGEYIYLDGAWEHVFGYDDGEKLEATQIFANGEYQKILPTDKMRIEELAKLPRNAKEIVYYDFEFGKGWKRREENEE